MHVTTMEPMDVSGRNWDSEKDEHGSINPFRQDVYNMGSRIGTNVTVMHDTHPKNKCKYLIIVNTETGERIRVTF